jgi:hypothetical protein
MLSSLAGRSMTEQQRKKGCMFTNGGNSISFSRVGGGVRSEREEDEGEGERKGGAMAHGRDGNPIFVQETVTRK